MKLRIHVDALGEEILHDGVSPVTWRVSARVLAMRDGKLLLVEHPLAERWELPGGGVAPVETLVEGATRECWEETGYHFHATSPAPVSLGEQFFYLRGKRTFHHSLIVVFAGTVAPERDPSWSASPAEIRRVDWLDPTALGPENVHAPDWQALVGAGVAGDRSLGGGRSCALVRESAYSRDRGKSPHLRRPTALPQLDDAQRSE